MKEDSLDELLYEVRGLCMRIHRQFGSGLPLGLLVNFQEGNFQHGMHRFSWMN